MCKDRPTGRCGHANTCHRQPHAADWIAAATATTELPSLRRFAQHLERDLDAVIAGLSQPWNSGVVEGHVHRKILKRQMFGRAGFELLGKRVLLYA
ncbi:hypothetical protein ACFVHS_29860 [Streptomyces sp. NPDC057746]|uniref:hypothetical protein n=1 Tax=Streptomyces sp. NPDC057746 TaxID=3346237 RepID=UPI0036B9CCA9